MKVRVQSKHLLDNDLLVKIWSRSDSDESERHYPLGKGFREWQEKPKTDLGVVSGDKLYFWMNWYHGVFQSQDQLIPSMILDEKPKEWRIAVSLDVAEKENSVIVTEDESSVYVYRLDTNELTRFRLVRKDGPRLIESREDVSEWLANKIAAALTESGADPNRFPEWLASKIATTQEEQTKVVETQLGFVRSKLDNIKQRRKDGTN